MNWNAELAYDVTPKCGPMRTMRTLRDANYALLDDLTVQCRYQGHWFAVGRLLMAAAESGGRLDVMLATDALVMALEVEGWITRAPRRSHSCQTKRDDIIALTPTHGTDQLPSSRGRLCPGVKVSELGAAHRDAYGDSHQGRAALRQVRRDHSRRTGWRASASLQSSVPQLQV
jgi:hypothetical protein